MKALSCGILVAAVVASAGGMRTESPVWQADVTYHGHRYATADEALEAERHDLATMVDGVTKEPKPLKGRALIVVPSSEAVDAIIDPETRQLIAGFGLSGDGMRAAIEHRRLVLRADADALVKARLFEAATVAELPDVHAPDIGKGSFLVWYGMGPRPDAVSAWRIRSAGSETPVLLTLDRAEPDDSTQHFVAFVKSVRAAAEQIPPR